MKEKSETSISTSHEFWEISEAAAQLTNHACTISARHLHDGITRSLFNREVAYYARSIVSDVEQGEKSFAQGLIEIETEHRSLSNQSREIALKGLGIVAGGFQIATGVGICYVSVGTLCVIAGVPLMAHGANNMYENGRNLMTGQSDTTGPLRLGYKALSSAMGYGEGEADIAYGAVDIGLSVTSLARRVLKPDAWRLFRYLDADNVRAYKTMHPISLTTEATIDAVTLKQIHEELKK